MADVKMNILVLPDGQESKYIPVIRRYSQSSISEILNCVRTGKYVLSFKHSDIEALRTMQKIISELQNLGAGIKIFESFENHEDMEVGHQQIENVIKRLIDTKQYMEKIDDLTLEDDD